MSGPKRRRQPKGSRTCALDACPRVRAGSAIDAPCCADCDQAKCSSRCLNHPETCGVCFPVSRLSDFLDPENKPGKHPNRARTARPPLGDGPEQAGKGPNKTRGGFS